MECSCGSHDIIKIDIDLRDGHRIEFTHCVVCESKVWSLPEEGTVPLQRVLEVAAAHRPRR